MSLFVQYHNCDKMGLGYLLSPGNQCRISTRRPNVKQAQGTVFLIVGVGRPRQYFLWEAFDIEGVEEEEDGTYTAHGPGRQLSPPQRLMGPDFEAFKNSCGKFVSFRSIDSLPYSATLKELADKYRAACPADVKQSFLRELLGLLNKGTKDYKMVQKVLKQRPAEANRLTEEDTASDLAAPASGPTKERSVSQQDGEPAENLRALGKRHSGSVQHEFLPQELLDRIRTVHKVVGPYLKMSLEEFIGGFMRDECPEVGVAAWCDIASAWLNYHDQYIDDKLLSDSEEKKLLSALIEISSGVDDPTAFSVPPETANRLIACYRGCSQAANSQVSV